MHLMLLLIDLASAAPPAQVFGGIGISVDPAADHPLGLFVDTSIRMLVDMQVLYGQEIGAHLQLRAPGLRRVDPWLLAMVGAGSYSLENGGFTPWSAVSAHAGIGWSERAWAWRAGGGFEKNLSSAFVYRPVTPTSRSVWTGTQWMAIQAQGGVIGRFDSSLLAVAVDTELRFQPMMVRDY
jgi:hypothetical protein